MKNIHVLPTDKPTWLHKSTLTGVLRKSSSCIDDMKQAQGMNIYITSDEEIKEGGWHYNLALNIVEKTTNFDNGVLQEKIILTDNKDLIDDGVQAIDDKFLEWFIKNPKSENVYVYKEYKQVNQNNPVTRGSTALGFSHYEVQSLDLSAPIETNEKEVVANLPNGDDFFKQEIPQLGTKEFNDLASAYFGGKPKQETQGYICPQTKKQCDDECCVSAEDCHIEASFGIISDCKPPKQETLEEVIGREFQFHSSAVIKDEKPVYLIDKHSFKIAVDNILKWQQERMYSEEDIREAYFSGVRITGEGWNGEYAEGNNPNIEDNFSEGFKQWFEQFKKK